MNKLIITLLLLSIPLGVRGQEIYLETLSVKTSATLPQKGVRTITKQDIEHSTATNITDLLSQYGLVNIQQRGAFGVQGDISIRGASFDQSIIKVNGLSINDPQTGHHNLDIPVPLASVERIEVTPSTVNIITNPKATSRLKLNLLGGQHSLWGGDLAINNLTYQHLASSGWSDGTEFKIDILNYQQSIPRTWGESTVNLGYIRKDFGAYKFYSQAFPDEKETTRTFLATGKTEFFTRSLHWQPQSSFRLYRDYFILDRNWPDWSFNDHSNSTIFLGLPVTIPIQQNKLITGVDFKQDSINSTNLQQHHRNAYSFSLEFIPFLVNSWQLQASLREDFYDPEPVKRVFRPGLDVNYQFKQNWLWLAGANRFYRLPTFTELYYSDPANKGSASLAAEKGWNYQTGVKFKTGKISWQNVVFWRQLNEAIDWTKYPGDITWQARNISAVNSYGLESTFDLTTFIKVNYLYLNNHLAAIDYLSKYNTNYLKHSASIIFGYSLPWQIKNDWVAIYRKPSQLSPYTLFDLKISRQFTPNWTAYLSGTNLLNSYYEDISGIPRPGRWLLAGIQYEL
ncbi:MAG: TonB-dependent receptor [bacterium]|nr:TonB-dependent receptor [bacterium]MDD5353783.1 TonB-dependent receptor [bacterium]MDD5757185.1 TonB-dependent receptor [bacterium]